MGSGENDNPDRSVIYVLRQCFLGYPFGLTGEMSKMLWIGRFSDLETFAKRRGDRSNPNPRI